MGIVHFFSGLGLFLCLTVLPFLFGKAFLWIVGRKGTAQFHKADMMLTGWIVGIGASEAVHLAALFLKRSFSGTFFLFAVVFGAMTLAAVGILIYAGYRGGKAEKGRAEGRDRSRRTAGKPVTTFQACIFLAFALLVVYQVVTITASETVYRTGDMTAETVESFLRTDAFYQVNPLTGDPYEEGMPFRLKILCLPTLYGCLCKMFGLPATEVVWKIVPLVTLLGSYLAFYLLAGCLFGEEDREKKGIFMLLAAAVFCVGNYMYGMDGFGLLYSGFRGVTIRNAVLLPYVSGLVLRRRWKWTALCILAEACIVWTLYGLGACLLAVLLLMAVPWLAGRISVGRAGKEA